MRADMHWRHGLETRLLCASRQLPPLAERRKIIVVLTEPSVSAILGWPLRLERLRQPWQNARLSSPREEVHVYENSAQCESDSNPSELVPIK